jgi:hypothetical protein
VIWRFLSNKFKVLIMQKEVEEMNASELIGFALLNPDKTKSSLSRIESENRDKFYRDQNYNSDRDKRAQEWIAVLHSSTTVKA